MNTLIFFIKLKNILEGKKVYLQGEYYEIFSVSERFFTVWTLFEDFSYRFPSQINSFITGNFLDDLYYFLDSHKENCFEEFTESFYLNQDKATRFLSKLYNHDSVKYQNILDFFHFKFPEKS